MKNEAEHRIRYYALTSETVFSQNSEKTTIFVGELRKKTAFLEVQNRFRRVEVRLRLPLSRPKKGNG